MTTMQAMEVTTMENPEKKFWGGGEDVAHGEEK